MTQSITDWDALPLVVAMLMFRDDDGQFWVAPPGSPPPAEPMPSPWMPIHFVRR